MGEKGFLTKEQEKFLAEVVDNAIKAKGFLELIDGYAARAIITVVDDAALDRINLSAELKTDISELIGFALDKDVEAAEEKAAEIINSLVDVPGLDEATEGLLIRGAVEFLVAAIIKLVRKE